MQMDQRKERISRRRARSLGSTFSTRLTISAPETPSVSANSRIAVRDGLNLARSRRLMYLGWYPLSKPSCSWVRPRRCRSSVRTIAKARFSGVLGAFLLRDAAMGSFDSAVGQRIVLQSILSICHERNWDRALETSLKKKNDLSESSVTAPNPPTKLSFAKQPTDVKRIWGSMP